MDQTRHPYDREARSFTSKVINWQDLGSTTATA